MVASNVIFPTGKLTAFP